MDLDDAVLDGVDDQIADGVQIQLPHDIAAMRFHGLGAQIQEYGHLLRTLAFGEKLRNFAFARGERR